MLVMAMMVMTALPYSFHIISQRGTCDNNDGYGSTSNGDDGEDCDGHVEFADDYSDAAASDGDDSTYKVAPPPSPLPHELLLRDM